jgi:hypothetical protein
MTVQGYGPRWKEHEHASLLACVQTMWRSMYRKYPHQRVANTVPDRDGTFQDLQQRMALGVRKSDKKAVTELFAFSPLDMERPSTLQYGLNQAGTLIDKQNKNIFACLSCSMPLPSDQGTTPHKTQAVSGS